ncbi:hypothetical protein I7634_03960 [Mycoplasma mycoides subsp. capri]|uniref:MSC_0882 family membrane protein n=1 Tax=Mycoplasma mycoides TaxID=2102 RepID=UPI00223F111E|nr:hypothetical protein [Mycoplasma mycoides]QVJ96211.1 hypothetical protein I7632_04335 [Mycoplasma mycoides subsp. capri]QVJ97105.1 hypothetical protein I7633_04280 [Mycoplasma mycoides subsp. capri]QVK00088.1 hypothetical protein I7634_03960 [Mycoplasma mycoides subsp. capri]QVK00970.1 hypothetical protein I7635_04280 [Mycoplasma mycoides subsp. capri]
MRDYNSSNNQNNYRNHQRNNHPNNRQDDRYYEQNRRRNNYQEEYEDDRYYEQNRRYNQDYYDQDDRYYDQDQRYDQDYYDQENQQNYYQAKYQQRDIERSTVDSDGKVKFIPDKKIQKIVRFNSIKSFISIFILVGLIVYFTAFLVNHYHQFLYDPNNIKQYPKIAQGWLYTMNGFKVWHLSVIIAVLSVCFLVYLVVSSTLFSNYNKYLKDMQKRTEEYEDQKLRIPYPRKPEEGTPPLLIKKMYKKQIQKPYYVNWFCLAAYIYLIVAGVIYTMFVIFRWGAGKLQDHETVVKISLKQYFVQPGQLTPYYILLGIFLAVVLIHIIALVSVKYVKNALEEYWITPILANDEIKDLEKKANRRSLIIFLILIVIAFFILAFFFIFFKIERRKGSIFSLFRRPGK